MYYIVVATLMLAFPVLSVAVEAARFSTAIDSILIGKWFVFWSVGWRLLLAGVRQIAQPEYTAREILGLQSAESWTVVRELGFGNLALGIVGVLSLWLPSWQLAAALAGDCSMRSRESTTSCRNIGIVSRTLRWFPICSWD